MREQRVSTGESPGRSRSSDGSHSSDGSRSSDGSPNVSQSRIRHSAGIGRRTESLIGVLANTTTTVTSLSGVWQAVRSGQVWWLLIGIVPLAVATGYWTVRRRWVPAGIGALAVAVGLGAVGLGVTGYLAGTPARPAAGSTRPTPAAASGSAAGSADPGSTASPGSAGSGSAGPDSAAKVLYAGDVVLSRGQAVDVDRPGQPPAGDQIGATGAYDLFLDRGLAYGQIHTHGGVYPVSGSPDAAYPECRDELDPNNPATKQYVPAETVSPGVGFCFRTSDGHVALAEIDSTISDTSVLLHVLVWQATVG